MHADRTHAWFTVHAVSEFREKQTMDPADFGGPRRYSIGTTPWPLEYAGHYGPGQVPNKLQTSMPLIVSHPDAWTDLVGPPDLGEVAGDCGLGFSMIKLALLITDLGAATVNGLRQNSVECVNQGWAL